MCLCLSRQRDAFEELCPDVSCRGVRKLNLCNEREGSSMAFHYLSLNLLTFLSKCVNSISQMEYKHFDSWGYAIFSSSCVDTVPPLIYHDHRAMRWALVCYVKQRRDQVKTFFRVANLDDVPSKCIYKMYIKNVLVFVFLAIWPLGGWVVKSCLSVAF